MDFESRRVATETTDAAARSLDQWYAEADGPVVVWEIFAEGCGAPDEPMPEEFREHLCHLADAGFVYADITAAMTRYVRRASGHPVSGWRQALDLTGTQAAEAAAFREEAYAKMTREELKAEDEAWVRELKRIAREEPPLTEIAAELDAQELQDDDGGQS